MNINFRPGDTVRVYEKVKEGEKTRLLPFEGVVIAIRGQGVNQSFTVRKIASGGIGVERIWPVQCPSISKIVLKKKSKTKRAKLYYLRKRVGRQALAVNLERKQKEKKMEEFSPISLDGTSLKKTNVQNKPQ